jgi:coenzyme F420-reducing hydrogenase gamma subunit
MLGFVCKSWPFIAIPFGNGTECTGCDESGASCHRRGAKRKAQPQTAYIKDNQLGNRYNACRRALSAVKRVLQTKFAMGAVCFSGL